MDQQYKQNGVIEGLGLCLKGLCDLCPYKNSDAPGGCKDELMYDALALLQLQEPKPPIIKENSYGWKFYYCPSCGKEFYQNNKFNFCEKCGQAVKWE